MRIKRVIAFLMAIVMATFAFVSCGNPDEDGDVIKPEKLLEKANEALLESVYSAKASVDFEYENPAYSVMFASLEQIQIDMLYNKGNAYMGMAYSDYNTEMTVIENTIYVSYDMGVMGSRKMKALATDEQLAEFMTKMDATAGVVPNDFKSISYEKVSGTYVITCSNMNEQKFIDVIGLFEGFAGVVGVVGDLSVDNVTYIVHVKGNQIQKGVIVADYVLVIQGVTVKFTMTVSMDYTYDNSVKVNAPADANSYVVSDYDDLFD